MEYYIALRDASKGGDESAANALMELQPYAVTAAEQALGRKDFVEAERLRRLLAAADPRAPSLTRMASAISRGLLADSQARLADPPATGEAESLVADAPAIASAGAPAAAGVPASIPTPASNPILAAPVTEAPPVAVAAPVESRTPAPMASRPPTAAPTQTSSRVELVALRTPQPEYPAERRQKGAMGQVVASLTVNSDGTVGEVRTESIGSRHIQVDREGRRDATGNN